MEFRESFRAWLADGLSHAIPDSVKAFAFNLYEPAMVDGVKFGIELIGAGEFDENDPDWACDEVWEPSTRGINIPVSYSGDRWEQCLRKLRALLVRELDEPSAQRLKASQGVGIGFVDGDLEVVWKPRQSDPMAPKGQGHNARHARRPRHRPHDRSERGPCQRRREP